MPYVSNITFGQLNLSNPEVTSNDVYFILRFSILIRHQQDWQMLQYTTKYVPGHKSAKRQSGYHEENVPHSLQGNHNI